MAYAIIASEPGPSSHLHQIEITPPNPGDGEVLIRQTAVGLSFVDIYFRNGLYPWPVERDLILGSEGAGVVEAIGADVRDVQIGDRVAYSAANGGYASHRVVPAHLLAHVPNGVSDTQAAAAMLKGLTSYYLLHNSYPVTSGETALVHAAAGGVGLLLGQWLAAKGVVAIGTAGGAEKCALAAQNGYAHVIDYTSQDFVARVNEITEGRGVPVVYDSVAKDTIAGSLKCLAPFGTLVNFGQSSGTYVDFQLEDLAAGSFYVQRPILFHYLSDRAWFEQATSALFAAIGDGTLKLTLNTWPLKDVAAAHDALEGRATTGSTVLIP